MTHNPRYRGQPGHDRGDYADRDIWDERFVRQRRGVGRGRHDEDFAGDDAGYAASRWYEDNSRGEMPPYLGESFNTHGYGGATGPEVDVRPHFGAGSDYGAGYPLDRIQGNRERFDWGHRHAYRGEGGPAAFADAVGIYRGHGPKGYSRKDETILEDVSETLAQDAYLDASGIEVKVKDGVVTLQGEVSTRQMKHRAENCADACSGVKDVENHLRVRKVDASGGTGQLGL